MHYQIFNGYVVVTNNHDNEKEIVSFDEWKKLSSSYILHLYDIYWLATNFSCFV